MLSFRRNALYLALGVTIASTTLVGCSGKEERQAKYLERAQQYLSKGDIDKARVEAKNVLQINANNANARFLMAQIEERGANWQPMFANLNAAIENDPNLTAARVKLAQLYVAAGDFDKASEQTAQVLQREADNADAQAINATILMRQQKTDEAIALAEKALQKSPGHIGASGLLATIYTNTAPEKAERILIDSIKLNSKENSLKLMLTHVYAKQGKNDLVIATLKDLAKNNPDSLNYPTQLANFYISQQRNADAEALLKQLVKDHPSKDEPKFLLVEFTAKNQTADAARALLEHYSAAAPDNFKLRSALARVYAGMNLPDKAIATYRYTIDKDVHAEGIEARNRSSEILLAQNKRAEAEALLADVLKLEPENSDALLTRARLALLDNDANAAIADTRTILKGSPDSPIALALQAAAQERIGAPNLALDNYKKILEKNPDNVSILISAARIELAQNQTEDAEKLLQHAHTLAATNIDVSRLLIELKARQKQFPQALALCDELILNSNTAAAGYYLKGLVLLNKKEIPDGIDALKKSLEKQPQAIEPLQTLVATYVGNKQSDIATSLLEAHVKTYPDQLHAQELLGALYRQTGKSAQAEQMLNAVLLKQPARISTYRELIAVYAGNKQNEHIGELLKKGLAQNPKNVELLVIQANYLQLSGDNKQAAAVYTQALELQPKSDMIKNNLAMVLIDKLESEDNLRQAQTLTANFADSSNPMYLDTLAWLQYKTKNYPQAIALLESALKKGVDSPELRYHLGMAYLKNGAPEKAKIELTKATEKPTQHAWRAEVETELKRL